MSSTTVNISAKILEVKQHGQAQADVKVEISFDGKVVGTPTLRVNRVGKEAEEIAAAIALRDARAAAPAPAEPKASKSSTPTKPAA